MKLREPLEIGRIYNYEFSVSLLDKVLYGANNIGMHFSETPIKFETIFNLSLVPQVNIEHPINNKEDWIRLEGTFEANNNAEYLIIGNFFADSSTQVIKTEAIPGITLDERAMYFIDDILVEPCLTKPKDTLICKGQEITLEAESENIFGWANKKYPSILLSNNNSLTISSYETTTYLIYSGCDTVETTVHIPEDLKDTTICQNDTAMYVINHLRGEYLWDDGSTNSSRNISKPGSYWVEINLDENCHYLDSFYVDYYPPPQTNFMQDTLICSIDTILLTVQNSTTNVLWLDSTNNHSLLVREPGVYSAHVIDQNQCEYKFSIQIFPESCTTSLLMPNVFTPNNDGINDIFMPIEAEGIVHAQLYIYNRWGKKIFATKNLLKGWDGFSSAQHEFGNNTYYWSVKYLDKNDDNRYSKGTVTLIK